MTKPVFPNHTPGCCPENYDEETGACSICGQTYDPIAWQEHLKRNAIASAAALGQMVETKAEFIAQALGTHDEPVFEAVLTTPPPRSTPNPVQGDRHCLWCDELFPFKRSTAIYCSARCRVAAMREERRHQERDCPKCNTRNGQLMEHHCANVLALDRIFDQRMRQGPPRS